ncbi:Peptidyl-tRNA hydrolase PTH2, putative [Angomonas deanei]|uniref:peptidyl-tRNA hydrolase n=1 Tax=Angomonas deanei TaxID=59799 RepID=A0A7G2CIF7_9TRYP|nr:Peptidyl-tRNA hydrolase PTH2, putative [Angomonas deanei]
MLALYALNFLVFFLGLIVGTLVLEKCNAPKNAGTPLPTRGERRKLELAKLKEKSESAEKPQDTVKKSDSEEYETTSSTDSEDSGSEVDLSDREYEKAESLRLKMVFVLLNHPKKKLSAQEAAVFTSSAGIKLMNLILKEKKPDAVGGVPASVREDWKRWFLWWGQVGCAKITLKCPESAMLDSIYEVALASNLPCCHIFVPKVADSGEITGKEHREAVLVGIGPAPSHKVNEITGHLKLLS